MVVGSWAESRKHSHQVCCTELNFATFVVEHNLPFALANNVNSIVTAMFPDSKVDG